MIGWDLGQREHLPRLDLIGMASELRSRAKELEGLYD